MAKPEIDINVGGDDSEPKEIQKNKFWHRLSIMQKKIAIAAGFIAGIAMLGNFGWMGVTWTKDKIKTAIDSKTKRVDSLARGQKYHARRIDSICHLIDTLEDYATVNRYHIIIDDSVIASLMLTVVINKVNFLKDRNGKLYYYTNGLLYVAYRFKNNSIYYYEGDDGKMHWCN